MREPLKYFLVLAAMLIGCTTASAAGTEGFKDEFRFINQRHWYISSGFANGDWQGCEWRADAVSTTGEGLKLTVSSSGGKVRPIGCAELHSTELLSYGLYEVRMRAPTGSGLHSGFFSYVGKTSGAPVHDEIDVEFLGKNPTQIEVNYYAADKSIKGKVVDLGFDASKAFHIYAYDWEPTGIKWYVDYQLVYETPAGTPVPSNPSSLFISLWTAGKGEDAWMGPFEYIEPVTAVIAWAAYTPPDATCRFPESLKCKQQL